MSAELTNNQIDQYVGISEAAHQVQGTEPTGPIEDIDEAHAVAIETKELEEQHAKNIGHYATLAAENAIVGEDGNVENRYPGNGDESNAMRMRVAVQNRVEADKLGDKVSQEFKKTA